MNFQAQAANLSAQVPAQTAQLQQPQAQGAMTPQQKMQQILKTVSQGFGQAGKALGGGGGGGVQPVQSAIPQPSQQQAPTAQFAPPPNPQPQPGTAQTGAQMPYINPSTSYLTNPYGTPYMYS